MRLPDKALEVLREHKASYEDLKNTLKEKKEPKKDEWPDYLRNVPHH